MSVPLSFSLRDRGAMYTSMPRIGFTAIAMWCMRWPNTTAASASFGE